MQTTPLKNSELYRHIRTHGVAAKVDFVAVVVGVVVNKWLWLTADDDLPLLLPGAQGIVRAATAGALSLTLHTPSIKRKVDFMSWRDYCQSSYLNAIDDCTWYQLLRTRFQAVSSCKLQELHPVRCGFLGYVSVKTYIEVVPAEKLAGHRWTCDLFRKYPQGYVLGQTWQTHSDGLGPKHTPLHTIRKSDQYHPKSKYYPLNDVFARFCTIIVQNTDTPLNANGVTTASTSG